MNLVTRLWSRSSRRRRAAGIGCLGLLALCGCLSILTAVLPSAPRTPAPTQPQRVLQPTQPPPATSTPRPAPTERPTRTPRPSATATQIPPSPVPPTDRPPATATTGPTFTVLEFRSPVPVNGDAHAVIQTQAGARCFIAYYTPGNARSESDSLTATTADANGVCAWTWRIGPSTTPGQGSVTISVAGYSQTLPIVIE